MNTKRQIRGPSCHSLAESAGRSTNPPQRGLRPRLADAGADHRAIPQSSGRGHCPQPDGFAQARIESEERDQLREAWRLRAKHRFEAEYQFKVKMKKAAPSGGCLILHFSLFGARPVTKKPPISGRSVAENSSKYPMTPYLNCGLSGAALPFLLQSLGLPLSHAVQPSVIFSFPVDFK